MTEFRLATRVVSGSGSADRVGELCAELGGRVLLVTDPGIVAAGHVERVEAALAKAALEVQRFDEVRGNPTTLDVDRCLAVAKAFQPDLLLGLGGGSAIDVAKGVNFVLTGGGAMRDYRGVATASQPLLPLIAVPTTAGTGTEVQSFALIGDEETHEKMACGDPKAAPKVAVLDPTLTVTLPPFVTACTGMDAIGHAVETAVTTKRNRLSELFSREAFRLASANLARVLGDPDDLEARGNMLVAATFAGIAIENSMLGAAHSMANPLTARFGVVHGQAVGFALPHVVRFNAQDAEIRELYAELARSAGLEPTAEALAARLSELLHEAGLAAVEVPAEAAPELAAGAAEQWTARFNPRPVGAGDFQTLFEQACG